MSTCREVELYPYISIQTTSGDTPKWKRSIKLVKLRESICGHARRRSLNRSQASLNDSSKSLFEIGTLGDLKGRGDFIEVTMWHVGPLCHPSYLWEVQQDQQDSAELVVFVVAVDDELENENLKLDIHGSSQKDKRTGERRSRNSAKLISPFGSEVPLEQTLLKLTVELCLKLFKVSPAAIQDSKVWILVDLPFGKKAIGTNGFTGIRRMKEVLISASRLFGLWLHIMGSIVYQMDVKSALLYGTIDEEVYMSQHPSFVDHKFPKKVYKVVKALYGLHQALRSWYATLFTFLLKSGYRRGTIDKTLFIKKDKNDIMLVQKPLPKDEEAADVDVHLYRSVIGSLMYLTTSRSDIMFAVCACSRFQYPRVSSFDLEAYSDSDYAGANLDRKSTTREAEYIATANYCRQVLWIQNQMLDYGFHFMNTKIYIDNESTICIVKNQVFHSKTKHIEIRHHFIRDAYEKKLIQMLKIHTDDNVVDLLTKDFDVNTGSPKLSTVRPKLSTDSTKIESMKLEAMVEERRIFKCWFYNHTTNGHQFTMSNRHQELASPKQTASELAIPKQTDLGKDILNPLIVDSLLKTIWLSMHHVITIKHWLFQSKRLLGRIVGFQKFLQLSAATYTSYYCQFYLVLLVKNAKDSRK
ncbi:putative ribonuclease H-like domain-containing protein [Tanacetum coccineum]|uniref:Ribonuclease H-like domain-containing protein n=1 Tax=Tanacetum coccineum TaxID=301880 RepID=A0ABQ5DA48_9ASTR